MTANYRRTIFLAGAIVATGLALTACSSDGSAKSASAGSAAGSADRAIAPAPNAAAATGGTAQQDTPAKDPNLGIDQRSIIYRGSISVQVKDVTAAASQTTGIATTAGGYVGSDNRSSGSGNDTATMELRVPADKFSIVVGQLSKLGKEDGRQIDTEDVTQQTIDLSARIQVQQASVDSARKLLASAKTLSDLVMLEKEVTSRESDLASLQAEQRHTADLVALSTITVTLSSQPVSTPPVKPARHGFLGGLAGGWHALVATLAVVLTVLGALLPWLIGIGLPALAVYYVVRRVRRVRTPAAPDAAPENP